MAIWLSFLIVSTKFVTADPNLRQSTSTSASVLSGDTYCAMTFSKSRNFRSLSPNLADFFLHESTALSKRSKSNLR
ncbi:unnamed protein product [Albugo candida]|uniref:Secreted protein n=1 Tax=Albugo candida TaxID=65357 RepID=A0A024GT14_9STRA|nr:unnamed protein product [Albugo candida]|eukprot:CCI49474.1 unnamed protein product [Albugo candida]